MKTLMIILSLVPLLTHARLFELQNEAQIEAENQNISEYDSKVKTCWGWSCASSAEVILSESDWNKLKNIFIPKAQTPRDERKQIALAIGKFEEITGELNGMTKNDLGAPNKKGIGKSGQTDCVDESTNTTRYLKFLKAKGYIHFHNITEIEMRLNKPLVPFLGQHFTATIQETTSNKKYAIDSWWYDNGTPAVVMTLSSWLKRDGFDPKDIP